MAVEFLHRIENGIRAVVSVRSVKLMFDWK
jgi:hypothetical protein